MQTSNYGRSSPTSIRAVFGRENLLVLDYAELSGDEPGGERSTASPPFLGLAPVAAIADASARNVTELPKSGLERRLRRTRPRPLGRGAPEALKRPVRGLLAALRPPEGPPDRGAARAEIAAGPRPGHGPPRRQCTASTWQNGASDPAPGPRRRAATSTRRISLSEIRSYHLPGQQVGAFEADVIAVEIENALLIRAAWGRSHSSTATSSRGYDLRTIPLRQTLKELVPVRSRSGRRPPRSSRRSTTPRPRREA